MSKLYIKAPDGRIVDAPSTVIVVVKVDGVSVRKVDVAALKPGWSVATAADVAALKAEQDAAEFAAALAAEQEAARTARLAAALDALANPAAAKGS